MYEGLPDEGREIVGKLPIYLGSIDTVGHLHVSGKYKMVRKCHMAGYFSSSLVDVLMPYLGITQLSQAISDPQVK